MIDKSNDYLLQDSTVTMWYKRKVTEGDATFNTRSVATFKAAASQVQYVKRESSPVSSPELLQGREQTIHIWRTPWLTAGLSGFPLIGDKLLIQDVFYIVTDVKLTDYDDTGVFQRFTLTCIQSKRTATA